MQHSPPPLSAATGGMKTAPSALSITLTDWELTSEYLFPGDDAPLPSELLRAPRIAGSIPRIPRRARAQYAEVWAASCVEAAGCRGLSRASPRVTAQARDPALSHRVPAVLRDLRPPVIDANGGLGACLVEMLGGQPSWPCSPPPSVPRGRRETGPAAPRLPDDLASTRRSPRTIASVVCLGVWYRDRFPLLELVVETITTDDEVNLPSS